MSVAKTTREQRAMRTVQKMQQKIALLQKASDDLIDREARRACPMGDGDIVMFSEFGRRSTWTVVFVDGHVWRGQFQWSAMLVRCKRDGTPLANDKKRTTSGVGSSFPLGCEPVLLGGMYVGKK